MATFKEIQEEIKPHKGDFVLDHFKVVKLLDIIDGKDDYYYVFQKWGGMVYQSSCVLSFVPLKGKIDKTDYDEFVRLWDLNKPYWNVDGYLAP